MGHKAQTTMAIVIPSSSFDLSKVTFTSINESTKAGRRHLSVRYDGQKCILNTPPCAFASGFTQDRGGVILSICAVDNCLLTVLRGLDRLLFRHILKNWESTFEGQVVPDRATRLAETFCPSIKHRGKEAPALHVRVSGRTNILRVDGTAMSADEIDVGGVVRQGVCGIELGLIRITSDRITMSLHADRILLL